MCRAIKESIQASICEKVFFLRPISFLSAIPTVAIWCHTGSWHFPEIKENNTVDPILGGGSGQDALRPT